MGSKVASLSVELQAARLQRERGEADMQAVTAQLKSAQGAPATQQRQLGGERDKAKYRASLFVPALTAALNNTVSREGLHRAEEDSRKARVAVAHAPQILGGLTQERGRWARQLDTLVCDEGVQIAQLKEAMKRNNTLMNAMRTNNTAALRYSECSSGYVQSCTGYVRCRTRSFPAVPWR